MIWGQDGRVRIRNPPFSWRSTSLLSSSIHVHIVVLVVVIIVVVVVIVVVVIVVVIDVVDDANSDRGEGLDEGQEWKDCKSVMFTFVSITIPPKPPGKRSSYGLVFKLCSLTCGWVGYICPGLIVRLLWPSALLHRSPESVNLNQVASVGNWKQWKLRKNGWT